jgi:hypothetical protein
VDAPGRRDAQQTPTPRPATVPKLLCDGDTVYLEVCAFPTPVLVATKETRYDNGSEVLTSDGIWMHHCVMSSNTRRTSMTPLGPQILWAGGNERPTLRLNTRYRYGIYWPADFSFTVEYMSSLRRDVRVRPAITFEYIERGPAQALGYRDSYLIWNSVGTPRYQNGSYSLSSRSQQWTVPKSGVLLHAMGHMHDGGTNVDLYINDALACSSLMYYDARPGYGSGQMAQGWQRDSLRGNSRSNGEKFGGQHISDPGHCTSFGRVEAGDRMYIQAYYNTQEFNVMSHNGKTEAQMGILRVFIGAD